MKTEIKNGLLSGGIASLCCLGPTFLVLLGAAAIFGISALCYQNYRPQFFLLGLFFLSITTFIYFRKRKINACELTSKEKTRYVAISVSFMIVAYALLITYIVPYLQSSVLNVNSCLVTQDGEFKCETCNKIFNSKESFEQHNLAKHPENIKKKPINTKKIRNEILEYNSNYDF